MDTKTKKQYKAHKIYRWIALFAKIISLPLFQLLFMSLKREIKLPISGGSSTLGAFLALLISLNIYYTIIFVLNRKYNFHSDTDLKKSIAVYILVALILFSIELIYANPLKNYLYDLTGLGLNSGERVIAIGTVKYPVVYVAISLGVTLLFSFISKNVIFLLFRKVLTKQEVLDRI